MAADASAGHGGSGTITVDDDGPSDFDTIQDAISHASGGETIVVEPGTYDEALTVPVADLTVRAASSGVTVDATGQGTTVLDIQADGVTIEGLTLTLTAQPDERVNGIHVDGQDAEILANRIMIDGGGCSPEDITGAVCRDVPRSHGIDFGSTATAAQIEGNEIAAGILNTNDTSVGGLQGISGPPAGTTITDNEFRWWAGAGIYATSPDITITRNDFFFNEEGVRLHPDADRVTIKRAQFGSNNVGVAFSGSGSGGVSGPEDTVLRIVRFDGTNGIPLELEEGTQGLTVDARQNAWLPVTEHQLLDTRIRDLGEDNTVKQIPFATTEGIEPGFVKVESGGQVQPADHLSIQAAIDAASPGDTILVPGSADTENPTPYPETITVDKAGLTVCSANDAVDACGGDPATTIVNGTQGTGPAATLGADDTSLVGLTLRGTNPVVSADGADRVRVEDNHVEVQIAAADRDGIVVQSSSEPVVTDNEISSNIYPGSVGIDVVDTTAPTVSLNRITGQPTGVHSGETVPGSGVGVRVEASTDGDIRGNVIRTDPSNPFAAQTLGISLFRGDGHRLLSNTYQGTGVGLSVLSSTDALAKNEQWEVTETAIELGATAAEQPTPFTARYGEAAAAPTIIELGSNTEEVFADLRLNDWRMYEHQLLEERVQDDGLDNRVELVPFLLPDGTIEPALPQTLGPATHSSDPATCDAHPDAEFKNGECRFLSVQAAIDFSHPDGRVLLTGSNQDANPTPYLESLDISTNTEGERLDGLTLCGSVVAMECASVDEPARWGIFSDATWGTPPVAHQGQAIRMDSARGDSTSLFTRDFLTGEGAPQVADLHGLGADLLVESGDCAPNNPRMTLRVDVNGNGEADDFDSDNDGTDDAFLPYQVYPGSSFTCPAPGEWVHLDYLESDNWGGVSSASDTQADAQAELGPDHQIVSMNLIVDSGNGDILWIDNQRYQDSFFREPGDQCSGEDFSDCRADGRATAKDRTIIDGSEGGDDDPTDWAARVHVDALTLKDITFSVSDTDASRGIIELRGVDRFKLLNSVVEGRGLIGDNTPGIGSFLGATNAEIIGNEFRGSFDADTDDADAAARWAIFEDFRDSLIKDNLIVGWSHGIDIDNGGNTIEDNTFRGVLNAVLIECTPAPGDTDGSIPSNHVLGNDFAAHQVSLWIQCRDDRDLGGPTIVRENLFRGEVAAINLVNEKTEGHLVDARLNDWGMVGSDAILETRVFGEEAPNEVLVKPYLDSAGNAHPPLPVVWCFDSSANLEEIGTTLGLQEAIDTDLATGDGFHTYDSSVTCEDIDDDGRVHRSVVLGEDIEAYDGATVDTEVTIVSDNRDGIPGGARILSTADQPALEFVAGSHGDGPNPEVIDVTVETSSPGIVVTSDDVTIENALVVGTSGPGILVDGASGVTVRESLIELKSGASAVTGIQLEGTTDTTVETTVIDGNPYPGSLGVNAEDAAGTTLTANRILGSYSGIRLASSTDATIEDNLVLAPRNVATTDSFGVSLRDGSGHTLEANLVSGAGIGLSVSGAEDVSSTGDQFETTATSVRLSGLPVGGTTPAADQPTGFSITQGTLLGDELSMLLEANTAGLQVDAECNDWGAYHAATIQSARIQDDGKANAVDFQPFIQPGGEGPGGCLVPPTADFTFDPSDPIKGEEISFTDQSTEGSKAIVEWNWTFGDGEGEGLVATGGDTTHAYDSVGVFPVVLEVTDADGMTSKATKLVDLANRAPILDPIPDVTVHHSQDVRVDVTASDPDGQTIQLSASNLPSGATFTDNGDGTGTLFWDPTSEQTGSFDVTITADDGQSSNNLDSETMTITVVNEGPVFDPPLPNEIHVTERHTLSLDVRAIDPDPEDDVTLVQADLSGLPSGSGAIFNSNGNEGTLTWTPEIGDSGTYTVTFTASGPGGSVTGSVDIVVEANEGPMLEPLDDIVIDEGELAYFTAELVEPDEDPISFSITGEANHGTALTYLPLDEPAGATLFADASGNGRDATCSGTSCPTSGVTGQVNTAASFDGTDDQLNLGTSAVFDMQATDTYSLEAWVKTTTTDNGAIIAKMDPNNAFRGYDLFLKDDGTLRAHAINDWSVKDAIVVDGSTAVNDGAWHHVAVTYDGSATATGLSLYVDGAEETTTVAEDSLTGSISTTAPLLIGSRDGTQNVDATLDEVAVYDRELTADEISDLATPSDLSATGLPEGASFTDNGDGRASFHWQTDFSDAGTYSFTVTVTDGVFASEETVSLTVNDVPEPPENSPPQLEVPTEVTGTEGEQITFDAVATDADGDDLRLFAFTIPEGATWTEHGDGTATFDWTPGFEDAGTYKFLVEAYDGTSGESRVVTISVEEADRSPDIDPIPDQTLYEGSTLQVDVDATDPDDDEITYGLAAGPSGVTVDDHTGEVLWTPALDAAGTHTITIAASDGSTTSHATFQVEVLDDAPQLSVRMLNDEIGPQEDALALATVQTENASNPIGAVHLTATVFYNGGVAQVELGQLSQTTNADGEHLFIIEPDLLETHSLPDVLGQHEVVVTATYETASGTPIPIHSAVTTYTVGLSPV